MSGALEAVSSFDVGGLLQEFPVDLGSITTDFGTEFMSSFDISSFEIPSFDVANLGGFGEVGSFAGSASWFDTFNPGAILDNIPNVSDFNISSLASNLPSLSSIKDITSTVTGGLSGITGAVQSISTTINKVSPIVNVASNALGIQNPLTPITQAVQQVSGVAGAAAGIANTATGALTGLSNLNTNNLVASGAAALGINPAVATPINRLLNTNLTSNTTDPYGLNILSDAEANALIAKTISPGFINSFADPAATGSTGLPLGITSQFTSAYDPETNQWSVFDNINGTTVSSGLSEQAAILAEQELNITNGIALNTPAITTTDDPFEQSRIAAEAALNVAAPTEADVIAAINGQTSALTNQVRAQQSVRELRNTKAQSTDWRVRLKLAPNSTYLYNAPANQVGILAPLALTDGVIFPYTPSIDTAYKANYDAYDLTHSNYRGYFYKGSYVDAVNIRAQFTAQDTKEADYLLAVIHFFRSCTKMFYGQDAQRGSPPPLVYLNGYGDYQFAEHPCVVSQFNYTLPPDVDYIRAQNSLQNSTNRLNSRLRNPLANNPLSYSVNRLLNSNLVAGALSNSPLAPPGGLASSGPTYVPTKMEISITLLPIQSRSQISNNFSVKEFANGNLLKGGYW